MATSQYIWQVEHWQHFHFNADKLLHNKNILSYFIICLKAFFLYCSKHSAACGC